MLRRDADLIRQSPYRDSQRPASLKIVGKLTIVTAMKVSSLVPVRTTVCATAAATILVRIAAILGLALVAGCASVERSEPPYQVGDTVVARHFSSYPQYNGTQVRVTGAYEWRWIKGSNALRCYAITTVDGQELAAQEFQLQRLVVSR